MNTHGKIIATIEARMTSTRLPGKVLLPLGNYNVTEHLLNRLQGSKYANEVVLSTSLDPRDDVLVKIAKNLRIKYFQGSKEDKLVRYRDTARHFDLDFLVVVDGDDPFVSIEHIDKIIMYARENIVDYVQYIGLPIGATGFGVGKLAIERICDEKKERNTEVWGHFFTENNNYKCKLLAEINLKYNRTDIRMTLDYPEDYNFFMNVVDGLRNQKKDPTFNNIIDYLNDNPEVVKINSDLESVYKEHLKSSMLNQN